MASERLFLATKKIENIFLFQYDTFDFAANSTGYLAVYGERTKKIDIVDVNCVHSCRVKNFFQRNGHYGASEFYFAIYYLTQYIGFFFSTPTI